MGVLVLAIDSNLVMLLIELVWALFNSGFRSMYNMRTLDFDGVKKRGKLEFLLNF